MPKFEDDRRKIVSRLEQEGWLNIGGKEHDNFVKDGHRMIQVPRHRTVSKGVARSISKAAGWH
jgi:predicted RNA binding protein YcfA (HicA-like mRNA interferase family)